jgi:hypothetical protein
LTVERRAALAKPVEPSAGLSIEYTLSLIDSNASDKTILRLLSVYAFTLLATINDFLLLDKPPYLTTIHIFIDRHQPY